MKILIIGGCGYIGSALFNHLAPHNMTDTVDLEWFGNTVPRNSSLDYDSLSANDLRDYDTVIMVAAHSSVAMCQRDPYGAFENNVGNFVRLLRKIESIKLNRPKLIYASSSCVYTGLNWSANELDELMSPVDHLTLTKQTIDHYATQSDVEFYGLRLGSVNGWSPNLRSDLMVNAMTMSACQKNVVRVTNPENYRPILGMDDLCRAVEAIVNCHEDRRGLYNVASLNDSIGHIGKWISIMRNARVEVGPATSGYDFQMSTDKFVEAFDFTFEDSIETIVGDLVTQFLTGQPQGRDVDKAYKNEL
jgi:UDP-glucose 4-epimerase